MDAAAMQQQLLAQLAAAQEASGPRPPLSVARKVLGSVLLLLAFVFLALNMTVLGHFGWNLGQNEIEKWVQMLAAGALPVMMTAIHPTYVLSWRPAHWYLDAKGSAKYRRGRPNWFLISLLSVLLAVALTINLFGGVGVMAQARKHVDLKATASQDEGRRLKESRDRLADERSKVPSHRPEETVLSEIKAHKLHPFWKATNGCSDGSVMNRAHRNYCRDFERLNSETSSARQAAKLNTDIASLDAQLGNVRLDFQAGSAQADVIGALPGMSKDRVLVLLSLLFPILLELMTLVPMVGAMKAFRIDHTAFQDVPDGGFTSRSHALLAPPARPEPPRPLQVLPPDDDMPRMFTGTRVTSEDPVRMRAVLDEFWRTRMRRSETGQTAEASCYALYQTFCAERACQEFDLERFRGLSAVHCRSIVELSGSIYYFQVVPA